MKSNDFRLDAGPEVDAAWKSLGADCEFVHYSLAAYADTVAQIMLPEYLQKKQKLQVLLGTKSRSRRSTEVGIQRT
jgi:hypothetical protein|tara:strand:+ start:1336 stop:1563 length:228 start_codon:yes stop_codon:yes gene_type:complete